ncbi:GTPase ObgE [Candidatus Peregrinibacteria bacterium]|nr:GTPase ObgE [Candidatus Peregrinibacteria bacterium]
MFLDEATIGVQGGTGGNGCVGWRREKYVAKGGPDGGNGGRGGSVIFLVDENTDTLAFYHSRKKFAAKDGKAGSGNDCTGRDADDLVLPVPPGTCVEEGGVVIADLRVKGEQFCVAAGGRGGYGNAHFKAATRQKPDFAEKGEPGQKRSVHLELKLVADIGIIGYPSVGKSTIISVISSARPKIADYPFTTLIPNLGVVHVDDRSYVVCDVPGLIEGASEGKGLGIEFLRHVERCGLLLHVLDLSRALEDNALRPEKLAEDYAVIRKELANHSPALAAKREVVIVNKCDLTDVDLKEFIRQLQAKGVPVWKLISAVTNTGISELKNSLFTIVLEERSRREKEAAEVKPEVPILTAKDKPFVMGAYSVATEADGTVRVTGKRIEQFTAMTNFASEGAMLRFIDVIERIGLKRAVKKARKDDSSPVFVGSIRIDPYL